MQHITFPWMKSMGTRQLAHNRMAPCMESQLLFLVSEEEHLALMASVNMWTWATTSMNVLQIHTYVNMASPGQCG